MLSRLVLGQYILNPVLSCSDRSAVGSEQAGNRIANAFETPIGVSFFSGNLCS